MSNQHTSQVCFFPRLTSLSAERDVKASFELPLKMAPFSMASWIYDLFPASHPHAHLHECRPLPSESTK